MNVLGKKLLCVGILTVVPAACGGGSASGSLIGAGGAPINNAHAPAPLESTTIEAIQKGKPVAGITITLSKNRVNGPVLSTGTTGTNGKVKLSGFRATQDVCAWGIITTSGGQIESELCEMPFPKKAKLDFS